MVLVANVVNSTKIQIQALYEFYLANHKIYTLHIIFHFRLNISFFILGQIFYKLNSNVIPMKIHSTLQKASNFNINQHRTGCILNKLQCVLVISSTPSQLVSNQMIFQNNKNTTKTIKKLYCGPSTPQKLPYHTLLTGCLNWYKPL